MSATRRSFLAAGLALPAAASVDQAPPPQPPKLPARAPAFTYRTLGKTGLKVTSLGFGCMITSDGSVVERAADLGITYFDTARGYQGGNNERMVGAALKKRRKDLVLSTKTEANDRQGALEQLDTSLKELGTDYVDIWYLHGKSTPSAVTDGLMEALAAAKKSGKTRFVGVSTHSGQQELMPWSRS
jgi:aryl-alcohol dehydrogenase-like predicted oxidoreductase